MFIFGGETMKITIKCTPKEIAALVSATQERSEGTEVKMTIDPTVLRSTIRDMREECEC